MNKLSFVFSLISIFLSLTACVGVYLNHNKETTKEIENEVYRRILGECWKEVKPIYNDFEFEYPAKPDSFRALLQPFISMSSQNGKRKEI